MMYILDLEVKGNLETDTEVDNQLEDCEYCGESVRLVDFNKHRSQHHKELMVHCYM